MIYFVPILEVEAKTHSLWRKAGPDQPAMQEQCTIAHYKYNGGFVANFLISFSLHPNYSKAWLNNK